MRIRGSLAAFVASLSLAAIGHAQSLTGAALIKTLQAGGNVIVLRHASSPRELPDKQTANPDNTSLERQLDEKGRATAAAMGEAFRRLKIPVGEVLTSPAYRVRETARLARFPNPRVAAELGEGPQTMQGVTPAQTGWLQKKAKDLPRGPNSVLVTHMPNVTAAFPDVTPAVEEGEALVFGPDGKGGARLVGRIRIEEWAGF